MTENQENVDPGEELPQPVADRTMEIIRAIMDNRQWPSVRASQIIPQENNMWEFRVHFRNNTTRRVRIGGEGTVTSDTTGPTNVLGERL